MPSDLEQFLLDRAGSQVTEDSLREIASEASRRFLQEDRPMNITIGEKVKEAGLNVEQARRVVEFANVETYSAMMRRGFEKNIVFPVADVAAVVSGATGGAEKTASVPTFRREKAAPYLRGGEYTRLEDHFGSPVIEKTASVSAPQAAHRLAADRRKAHDQELELQGMALQYEEKLAELKSTIQLALRRGDIPATVGAAIELARPRTPGLRDALAEEFGDLVEFGGHLKIAAAGMMMVPGNPVTGLTQDLDAIAQKMIGASSALERTRASMSELLGILQPPPPPQPSDVFQASGQPQPMQQTAPMPQATAPQAEQAPQPAPGVAQ